MSRLSRNKIGDDLNPEDWRIHRRWVLGMCGFYVFVLLVAVTFTIVNQQTQDSAAAIATRVPTQKLSPGGYATVGSTRQSAMNSALDRAERETFKK